MATAFSIRTTIEDDWPLVREFRIENATDNPISYGATLETTLGMTEADWRLRARRGDATDATSLVATETSSGQWIGMMSAQDGDRDGSDPVLTGVYVTPQFRGRASGVADTLLERILGWAAGRGQTMRLYVYEDATPAKRFYGRHNFEPTGRTRVMEIGNVVTLDELARPLI
jgi:GNAT superfamily N-acetyltransferase